MLSSMGYGRSQTRDEARAKVIQDKIFARIRAWEDNKKSKAINKFNRTIARINAWENTRKATAQAMLRDAEEALEKRRAAYVEKMKNKISEVHREAEEMRAIARAVRGEELLHAEESATRHRSEGTIPNRFLCFG